MFRVILLFVSTLVVAHAAHKDFLDDEVYTHIMAELDMEEEQARNLMGIEADGSLGSKCGIFNPCGTGFECLRNRCYPNRDCMKDQLQDFNESFDSAAYKQMMFQRTGVTEEDVIAAYQESGDEVSFVASKPMQSLIGFMQENWEPFEPLSEIADSCSGVVSGRRLNIERVSVRTETTDSEERRLETTTAPTGSPSTSSVPSGSPSLQPSSSSESPSMAPSVPRSSTTFLGIHLEGGLVFELSLSVAWLMGRTSQDTLVRGCFGAELGGGVEFSFYVAIVFDGLDRGWACGSVLFDTDVGLGLNLGFGLGICFAGTDSVYVEFTVGGGFGAGIGFNVCGVLTQPPATNSTTIEDCGDGDEDCLSYYPAP